MLGEQLMRAIKSHDPSKAHLLIEQGADVEAVASSDPWTPWENFKASLQGNHESMRYELRALMVAVIENDERTVRQLLRHGANVNAKTRDGETALFSP